MKKLFLILVCVAPVIFFGCGKFNAVVSVEYTGPWSGAIGGLGDSTSYDGIGNKTIEFGQVGYLCAVVQKMSNDNATMTVKIIQQKRGYLFSPDEDVVVKSGSTSAQYGVVTVSGDIK